jgi:hypothetical protein
MVIFFVTRITLCELKLLLGENGDWKYGGISCQFLDEVISKNLIAA